MDIVKAPASNAVQVEICRHSPYDHKFVGCTGHRPAESSWSAKTGSPETRQIDHTTGSTVG
jgi:hypothetical protein